MRFGGFCRASERRLGEEVELGSRAYENLTFIRVV